MSTTSPEGDRPSDRPGYGYSPSGLSRMPVAGNTELLIFLLVWLVIFLLWLFSDEVDAGAFATLTVALTFGYLISRGIAKAGRVVEDTEAALRR
jgi:hypothetical protein